MRSRPRWYEHGERTSKYFYNLEKRNQKKKHITSLVNNVGDKITNPKHILEEEERFFTAPFNNMRTLKFEAQPTNGFFAAVNQVFGGSS